MNPNRRTNALLDAMSRRHRPGRFSMAPITLGLALLLGILLLTEMVPRVWNAVLPGGLAQASTFRGWPGQLLQLARWLFANRAGALMAVGGLAVVGLPLASRSRAFRWTFRLLALAAILADFAIVYAVLYVAYVAVGSPLGAG